MQSAILGNGLVLQNLLHMQMAQQQLLQIKDKQITNVRVCVCVLLKRTHNKEIHHHISLACMIFNNSLKLCS